MDKELAQLHDLARKMLLEVQASYEAGTLPPGFGASDKRRVDKAISNLDKNHEAYGDIMDNVLTGNKGPKKLMKDIRGVESRTMAAWQLLNDDTIHHLIQQRTGGNFSKKVSGDVVRGAVKRLEDRFGIKLSQATGPKGVIRGDTSLSNFAHKSDDKGAGLERKAIGKNPDPSTTAHRYGNAAYSRTLTDAETVNEKALAEALGNLIEAQLEDAKVGIATDAPRVEAVRSLDPRLANAYKSTNTVEEISEMKGVIKSIPNIEEQLIETYQVLEQSKGSVRFNRNLSKFGKGVSRIIPGSFDDAIIGGVLGTGAAGAVLLTGGSPAQAGKAFLETGVDVATGDLQGGNLADSTLQPNLDKVKKTLYQEPVNIAAPTGVTTFDAVAQPLIKGLAGQPMGLKKNKGSIVFGF